MEFIAGKPPEQGSVVWAYAPCSSAKAPVKHPCLVLKVATDEAGDPYLVVASGKSSVKDGVVRRVYADALPFYPGDAGFHVKSLENVLFSFADENIHILPYAKDFFYVAPGQIWPKIGHIDLKVEPVITRMREIRSLVDIKSIVEARCAELGRVPVTTDPSPVRA